MTSVDYDSAGLPARIVAADGVATDVLVDDKQRIVGARFANGDAVGLELDEFGRPIAVDVNDDRWVTAAATRPAASSSGPIRLARSSPRSTATSAAGCRSATPPGIPGGWSATSSIACAR